MVAALRTKPTFSEELELRALGYRIIAGIDEVGRGPLAGPVVAAAVALPDAWFEVGLPRRRTRKRRGPLWRGINDSKQLSAAQRESLYPEIVGAAVAYGVGIVPVDVIDRIGIAPATKLAMTLAIGQMSSRPDALLVDAIDLSVQTGLPCRAIIDGDALCGSIAAASIVAKVTRDRLMQELDQRYPGYGFAEHKGYATREHMEGLERLGPCSEHRRSFAPIRELTLQPRLL